MAIVESDANAVALTETVETTPDLTELVMLGERTWVSQAVCKGRRKWFFDSYRETQNQREKREAIAAMFCQACPVVLECRDYARQNREHGFWGGESEEDRTRAGYMPRSTGRRSVLEARRAMAAEAG